MKSFLENPVWHRPGETALKVWGTYCLEGCVVCSELGPIIHIQCGFSHDQASGDWELRDGGEKHPTTHLEKFCTLLLIPTVLVSAILETYYLREHYFFQEAQQWFHWTRSWDCHFMPVGRAAEKENYCIGYGDWSWSSWSIIYYYSIC